MFNIEEKLIPFFLTATLLTVIFIFFMIVSFVRLKNRQIKKEHQLMRALVEERERTMYTISVEIHDNINQMLSLATMGLKMVQRLAVPEQEKYITQTRKMLDDAMNDLRTISHSLNATYLTARGLYESLADMVKSVNDSRNISCVLDVEGQVQSFAQDMELMIIRIAQEAVQNTLKHAKAKHIHILLDYQKQEFSMKIKDDGCGFQINSSPPWAGVGLQSMYERSRIIKGTIILSSTPELGTELWLRVTSPPYIDP
jgi:two-component system NarL family sensor kinase